MAWLLPNTCGLSAAIAPVSTSVMTTIVINSLFISIVFSYTDFCCKSNAIPRIML